MPRHNEEGSNVDDEEDEEEDDDDDDDDSSEEDDDDNQKGGYSIRTHSGGGGKQLRQLSGAPGGGKMLRVPDANANDDDEEDEEESDDDDDEDDSDDDDNDEDDEENNQRSTIVAAAPRVGGGKQLRMPGGGKQLRPPGGGKQLRAPPPQNENDNNDDEDEDDESSEEEEAAPPRPSGGGKSLANMARGGGKQLRPPPAQEDEEEEESSSEEDDDEEEEEEKQESPPPPAARPMGGGKSLGNMGYGSRGGGKQLRPPSPAEDEENEDEEEESSEDEDEEEDAAPMPSRPFGGGKALGNMGGGPRGSGKQLRPPSQTKDEEEEDEEDEEESSSSEEEEDGDEPTRIVQRPAGGKMLRPPPAAAPSPKESPPSDKAAGVPPSGPGHASSESEEDSGDESDDQKQDSKSELAREKVAEEPSKDVAKTELPTASHVEEPSKREKDDDEEMDVSDSSSSSDQEEDDVAVKPWAKKAEQDSAPAKAFTTKDDAAKKEEPKTAVNKTPIAANDDFEAEAELSSDDDENGEFEEMDVDNMDSRDLVKDEEDQKYLDSLPELEREAVLGERFEKLKMERDMKKALREAKQRERDRQSSGKKPVSPTKRSAAQTTKTKGTLDSSMEVDESDTAKDKSVLYDKVEQEKGRSVSVDSGTEKSDSDKKFTDKGDDMIIDDDEKASPKTTADKDVKSSTERTDEKRDDEDSDEDVGQKGAEKDEDDEDDIDYGSSEDDSDDSEADVSKPWAKNAAESASKTRKTLSANNRIGGKLSDMRDSGDESSDSEGRSGSGKAAVEASMEDFKTICLPRRRLARWCNEPWFEQAVVGCYVRLGLGVDEKTKKFVYRFCRVVGVTETNHTYTFPKKPTEKTAVVSAKQLTLEFGTNQRNFRMLKISDSPPTELEVMKYVTQVKNGRNKILSRSMARKIKREQSQLIDNYKYTKDDIERAIEEKKKLKLVADNVAKEKTRIEIEVQAAKEALDEAKAHLNTIMMDSDRQDEVSKAQRAVEAAEEVLEAKTAARVKILEVDAKQKKRALNTQKIQNWAKVNQKAKQKNRKADYLSYKDQRVHGKGASTGFNPYARRNKKPEILWEVGQRREKDAEGGKPVLDEKLSEKAAPDIVKQEIVLASEDAKRRKQKESEKTRKKLLGIKHQIGGYERQNGEQLVKKKRVRRGISLKDYQQRKASGAL